MKDIVDLPEIQNNDTFKTTGQESIIRLLHSRFKLDQPYTQLGEYKLIVVNPSKPLELLNDATLEAYGNHGYKDFTMNLQPEPHVYDMTTRAYLLMRRKSENQVIVLRYIHTYVLSVNMFIHTSS